MTSRFCEKTIEKIGHLFAFSWNNCFEELHKMLIIRYMLKIFLLLIVMCLFLSFLFCIFVNS